MKSVKYIVSVLIVLALIPHAPYAQFNVDGQMLIRSEFRNGYLEPLREGLDPAGFIAHRARLQASYQSEDFKFYMSIQDVRTWGSTSQANVSDNFLSAHEAWGEVKLGQFWKIKLGRQELNYDNARFLGNLDWALQARSHDFALAKYEKGNSKLHFGGGFNQDGQRLSGNTFTTANQYRTAQLARYQDLLGNWEFALLFWNEGRQSVTVDTGGNIIDEDIHFRQTIGIPTLKSAFGGTTLSGFFYYQLGEDVLDRKVSGFNASAQVSQELFSNDEGRKWRATLGYEAISGTDGDELEKNNSYTLQYGTNHAHNGYLDWFFVANRWENSTGLNDFFLRSRYTFGPKLWMQADFHQFSSFAKPLNLEGELTSDKRLGSEIDLVFGLVINSSVSLQGGYSQLFTSDEFERINSFELKGNQNWAYLMFVFRPTSNAKFIGVLQ